MGSSASPRVRRQAEPVGLFRAASFAARTAQALVTSLRGVTGCLQLYVDDPVLAAAGHPRDVEEALDLVLLWWLLLGGAIAWRKGNLSTGGSTYMWMGVDYALMGTTAIMTLPQASRQGLLELLAHFTHGRGHASAKEAQSRVRKAGRVAHIVLDVRPFVSALYTTLQVALNATRAASVPGAVARRPP